MCNISNGYINIATRLFFLIVFIFLVFILLLFIFKTEKLISITGNIIAEKKITINSLINGDIEKIFIKNGDFVAKGDPLFSYSISSIKQVISEYKYNIDSLILNKNTILNVAYDVIYYHPINIEAMNNKLENLSVKIRHYEGLYLNKKNLQLQGYESLESVRELDLELSAIRLEYNNLELEVAEAEKRNTLNIEILKNYGVDDLDIETVNRIISSINTDISQYDGKMKNLEELLNNPIIISPMDGIINFYDTYYYNDVNKNKFLANDLICDIYSGEDYIAKGLIPDIYLPFIKVCNDVYINVKAYNYNNYGFIHGKISKIYTTPVIIDKATQYYIDITFDPISYPLFNGLDATISIKLSEEETLFSYILNQVILKESTRNATQLFYINRKIIK